MKIAIGIVLAALIASPAVAEGEAGLEKVVREQGEMIRKLQGEVERMRGQSNALLEQDIQEYLSATEGATREQLPSSVGGTPMWGQRVRLGGYFTTQFRDNGSGEPLEFDFLRLVPKIQAQVAEGITFETEIEIEGGGSDVDFLTDNEILVEYAELTFALLDDKLDFVAGLILLPWGRYNHYHDDPLNDLPDRPLVSRYIGSVAAQQPGVAVQGTLEAASSWFLDYDVALVQGFHDGFSTANGVRDARPSFREDNNDNKQVFGRFAVTPPLGFVDVFEVGGSFAYGEWDASGDLSDYGWGVDLFVKRGRARLTAEYMWFRIEQPSGAPATEPERQDGWYVEAAYDVFPAAWRGKHLLFTEESTFTFIVRVEGLDLNQATDGTEFRDDLSQVTIGFAFRPVRRTVIKISYAFVDSHLAGTGDADVFVIEWSSYF
jgi:hypothetical protein